MNEFSKDVGKLLAQELGDGVEAERLTAQRALLMRMGETPIGPQQSWFGELLSNTQVRYAFGAMALGAAAWALVATGLLGGGASELSVASCVSGGEPCSQNLNDKQWIDAAPQQSVELAFSEGSEVTLEPESRGRINELLPNEAELTLESGQLIASIESGQNIDWTFHAGPYSVRVVGTELGIRWDGADSLAVWVTEGEVRVDGAHLAQGGVSVAAGQRLVANHPNQEFTVIQGGAPRAAEEQATEVRPDAEKPATVVTSEAQSLDALPIDTAPTRAGSVRAAEPVVAPDEADKPAVVEPAALPEWKRLAQAGEYAAAMQEAEGEGFSKLIQGSGAWDVMLLADAARLSSRTAQAREALNVLRSRFAGQRAARLAAFRLGRLALDQGGNSAEAARWLQTFLAESGGKGELVEAARGRLMGAYVRLGQKASARRIARDYLKYHPSGQHTALARSLVSSAKAE